MSSVLKEVLAANEKYVETFGARKDWALSLARALPC